MSEIAKSRMDGGLSQRITRWLARCGVARLVRRGRLAPVAPGRAGAAGDSAGSGTAVGGAAAIRANIVAAAKATSPGSASSSTFGRPQRPLRVTEDIQLVVAEGAARSPMGADLARPASGGRRPGVIVGFELFGMTGHIRGISERDGYLLFLVGARDNLFPPGQREAIEEALLAAHVRHEMVVYPDGSHGIFCDERASVHQGSPEDTWRGLSELFARELAMTL